MRGLNRFFISFFVLFSVTGIVNAQNSDFNLWTSFSIEKRIIKDLDFEIEIDNRLKNNLQMRDETLADIGLKYSPNPFAFSVVYRITNVNKGDSRYVIGNRFTYQAEFQQEIKRFTLELRAKYQDHYEAFLTSEDGRIPESFIRTRGKLEYNIKGIPLDPFISFESFLRFNSYTQKQVEKERYSFGASYKLNKKNAVGFVFHYQKEINIAEPDRDYILALKYSFEL